MRYVKTILVSSLIALSGCTTIHFDNGAPVSEPPTREFWHHDFVFALVEGSNPVNLKKECGDKDWGSVQTQRSFLNGTVEVLLNAAVWSPRTVTVTCQAQAQVSEATNENQQLVNSSRRSNSGGATKSSEKQETVPRTDGVSNGWDWDTP